MQRDAAVDNSQQGTQVTFTFLKDPCKTENPIDNPRIFNAESTVGDIRKFIRNSGCVPEKYPKIILNNKKNLLKLEDDSQPVNTVNTSGEPLSLAVGFVTPTARGGKRTKKRKHNHRRNKTKSALSQKKIKRYSVKAKRRNRRKSHKRA